MFLFEGADQLFVIIETSSQKKFEFFFVQSIKIKNILGYGFTILLYSNV